MAEKNTIVEKVRSVIEEVFLYWNHPRPGEYVPYKEIVMLSLGWMVQYFTVQFSISFGVGNVFTGQTLKMNNNELLVMGYVCQIIGYAMAPFNSWLVDNLRSAKGKYRVYIQLAIPSMILTLIALWLPYEQLRDGVSRYVMIAVLFLIGQIQGTVQSWFQTGITNMVYVITPNSQERAKIMSITGIVYSFAPTLLNIYMPAMVDILKVDKFSMAYYRGTYTPLALFAPLALVAFFGTQERLVLPKSRITKMSFGNSIRSVAGNRIFWIKCFDAWNDFLEGAKGNVWEQLVYRAHIVSSTTYGFLNTLCHNAQLWSMIFSPWFIKKFGKKKIKVFKNIVQVFVVAGIGLVYKSKFAIVFLFILNYINRFVDCAEVIDKAIESDMRDTQQYLVGERIDGSFGMISTYANGFVGMFTGLFLPWIYAKCGFDGNDYSVLDVYIDYNPDLPLSQQQKNPNCVLYSMLDVLIAVSVFGAVVDVIPWLFYDVSETGQKSMLRVIRLRTMVEDKDSGKEDVENYLEGCRAVMNAQKYIGLEKVELPKDELKKAKLLPKNTDEEKELREKTIKEIKQRISQAETDNEEIEIAKFVMFEINRFSTEFGAKQLELAKLIVNAGSERFYEVYEQAVELATNLPKSSVKEEKIWRRQEVRNANSLRRSMKLAYKYYPDGNISFDPQCIEDAYNMPDETREEQKARRKAMKKANKEQNIYSKVAFAYLSALRTVKLAEGYENLSDIMSDYDEITEKCELERNEQLLKDKKIAEERRLDMERKKAQKKLKK
ncbi:MAG: MFS transporter [Clostridia bacterium]|nr:MFS transporter [Clostridia bacterium]